MADECTPYVPANPGDLITAENWNDMQCKAKEDIKATAAATEAKVKEEGVSKADNAGKFDGKSAKEWTDKLDERYAGKVHDHEGMANYRRFIKRFTPELDKVLLHHKLGRFPLVDIYRLEPVIGEKASEAIRKEYGHCKLLFYYGHADAEAFGLAHHVYREKVRLGLPFGPLLDELGVDYEDDDTIEDVLNDMWDAFMKEPNDELEHCQTPWVAECCGKRRTVGDLKKADQWDDLYVAILPIWVVVGEPVCRAQLVQRPIEKPPEAKPVEIKEKGKALESNRGCHAVLAQVNYDTIYLAVEGLENNVGADGKSQSVDLMILLRS